MTRALLKTGAALALDALGGTRLLRRYARRAGRPTILYFHRVLPDPERMRGGVPAMALSCASFEWLLEQLARHYRFVSLEELGARRRLAKPELALTFDDGYRDFYDHAFPILARKGVPAAVFVITGLIGTAVAPLHDRLYASLGAWWQRHKGAGLAAVLAGNPEIGQGSGTPRGGDLYGVFRSLLTGVDRDGLERLLAALEAEVGPPDLRDRCALMDWEMLAGVQAAGIAVGSHTRTHALLPNERPPRVRDEVQGSLRELERRLGPGPRFFSYPDGRFHAASVRAVAAAGYRRAFTTCACRDTAFPSLTIPRRHLWEAEVRGACGHRSRALLACRAAGALSVPARCRSPHAMASDPVRLPARAAEVL